MTKSPSLTVIDGSRQARIRYPETVAEILTEALPTYALRPLLAHRAVHVLYGDSQTGKTFLALDLAATIATGGTWQERSIKPAGVLYISAEGNGGIGKRLRALTRKYPGLPAAPLRILRQGVNLIEDADEIMERARAFAAECGGIVLIVLDTLAQTMGGRDENGPDMAAYVSRAITIAEAIGAAVLIVHHGGKDSTRGARGHSALRGNVDAIYRVTVDESGTRTVVAEKARDDTVEPFGYRLDPVPVGRDEDGIVQTSCTVSYIDAVSGPQRRAVSGAAARLLIQLAGDLAKTAGEAGRFRGERPVISAETLAETWAEVKRKTGQPKQGARSYFSRTLVVMVTQGHLCQDGDAIWFP